MVPFPSTSHDPFVLGIRRRRDTRPVIFYLA